jgi:hypothetical protein
LRDHHLQLPGDAKHMLGDLQAVGARRMKREQRAVEARELMRLRHRLDMGRIEHRAGAHDGLGRIVVGDEADELDRHGRAPVSLTGCSNAQRKMRSDGGHRQPDDVRLDCAEPEALSLAPKNHSPNCRLRENQRSQPSKLGQAFSGS